MVNEDFLGFQLRVQFEKAHVLRLLKANDALQQKVDKYTVQRSREVDIPESEI